MSTHRNNGPRAWRLILAKLHADLDAEQIIHNEIGFCPRCWADTADAALEIAATLLVSKAGGNASAGRIAEAEVALSLEAQDRDHRGLPVTPEWAEKCIRTHLSWMQ